MKATIGIEYMGGHRQPLISKITDFDTKYKYKREFLTPKLDFTHSNSKGDGTQFWYVLEDGIYEVRSPRGKYFVVVTNGDYKTISENEVQQCLKERCLE